MVETSIEKDDINNYLDHNTFTGGLIDSVAFLGDNETNRILEVSPDALQNGFNASSYIDQNNQVDVVENVIVDLHEEEKVEEMDIDTSSKVVENNEIVK